MDYKNVREALKFLLEYNDSKLNPNLKTRYSNGGWVASTSKDVQEVNYESLANMADLLGMSDLYLGGTTNDKTN